jgi:asparagine synthase (glutamine-hydrolysing)
MCGIAGSLLFNNSHFRINPAYLIKIRDTMIHRGPDGAGIWISGNERVGLAHRRLSIIDLSDKAAQPMSNTSGTVVISFNGEIYNHADIRRELERNGKYIWKTDHSDTEVIVHAFEEWGIDCVQRFRGMFAIAIWDSRDQSLWLIRDRSGIKPLYYSLHSDRVVFASEIKAILADPQQTREVNERGFYDYLSFLCVPAPDTLFKGIHKVVNGHWMRISSDGSVQEKCYWDPLDHLQDLMGVSEEQVAHQLLDELRESIQIHKASDVPIGIFLSGGIDSSTNAALFSRGEQTKVKTFSIGYSGEYDSYQNELHYARLVADKVGAEYYQALLTSQDLLDFLPLMVQLQDEPISDPVCVPVYYVSKLARDNDVIVCQVGEGADELFWGYSHWKTSLRLQTLSDLTVFPPILRKGVVGALSLAGLDDDWRYEYIKRSSQGLPIFWGGAEVLTHKQKIGLLSRRLREKFKNNSSWEVVEPIWQRFKEKSKEGNPLDWMSYVDLNRRLPELLLMRVDKMSMGVSLETRVPFLDHKFVEFAMSIPAAIKTKNGTLKYILKKAVRGVIPDAVIDRKKQGFGVPIPEWFKGDLGKEVSWQLKEFCDATDLLDWSSVESLLNGPKQSKAWHLLNAAMWWKEYIRHGSF